jgi:hypothetical protein
MKRNVVVTYGRCELQYGGAINNDAGKNMQCKNAVVKCSVASPMFQRVIREILVLRNQFVQKETEECQPKNSNEFFF